MLILVSEQTAGVAVFRRLNDLEFEGLVFLRSSSLHHRHCRLTVMELAPVMLEVFVGAGALVGRLLPHHAVFVEVSPLLQTIHVGRV